MDIVKLAGDAFGVGIVNAIGLVIFWFVGKSLFTKVLDTAAAKALEDRKNAFTKELEDIRQHFARELESERNAFQIHLESERRNAARALEEFKADLTLGAEVRRQVAQRKVAILLEIVAKGEPLIRTAINRSANETDSPIHLFMEFMTFIRSHQHLLTKATASALYAYNAEMAKCSNQWQDPKTIGIACQASDRFLDLIRSELGIG